MLVLRIASAVSYIHKQIKRCRVSKGPALAKATAEFRESLQVSGIDPHHAWKEVVKTRHNPSFCVKPGIRWRGGKVELGIERSRINPVYAIGEQSQFCRQLAHFRLRRFVVS